MSVRNIFPDASLFNGRKGEKTFFTNKCHKFFIHPDSKKLRVKVRRDNDLILSFTIGKEHFGESKFAALLRMVAATAGMLTTDS